MHRYTQRDNDYVYAIVLDWPRDDILLLGSISPDMYLDDQQEVTAEMLGNPGFLTVYIDKISNNRSNIITFNKIFYFRQIIL